MLFVVSGPCCAGKRTVIEHARKLDPRFKRGVTWTTRPRGRGEVDGEDYHFTTRDTFLQMVRRDEFLEYDTPHVDHYYGTPRSVVEGDGDVILEVNYVGARSVRERVAVAPSLFILPPSLEEMKRRIKVRKRGESQREIVKRVFSATKELFVAERFDGWIVNREVEESAEALLEALETFRNGRLLDAGKFRNMAELEEVRRSFALV